MSKNIPKDPSRFPRQGRPYFGQAIGIIMEKEVGEDQTTLWYTRIPGDVGNATTFKFPVQYKVVELGNVTARVPSRETVRKVVEAARELESEGVKAIGCMCGFMIYFQEAMANAVNIPVFSSALLQVPVVSRLIGKGKKVGIIVWDSRNLTKEHLKRAGIDESMPIVILGLETMPAEGDANITELEPEKRLEVLENHLVYSAKRLVSEHPDLGAIVLECTNLPPAAAAVQKATGLPVFDVTTLLNWAYDAVVRKKFTGFM